MLEFELLPPYEITLNQRAWRDSTRITIRWSGPGNRASLHKT